MILSLFLFPASALFLFPASAQALSLSGNWRQDCRGGYQKEERFADESSVSFVERNFRDNACTVPAAETVSRGHVIPGKPVAVPDGADELDFVFDGVTIAPLDEAAARFYEKSALCGLSGWKAGEAKEISGLRCAFFGGGANFTVPKAGYRKFGIVKQSETGLFFGRLSPERDGSTPEARPVELDPEPFRRIP